MGTELPSMLDEVLDPDIVRARRAVRQIEEWTAKRDQAVRDLRARGFTLRAIGEAVGMTSHRGCEASSPATPTRKLPGGD